MWGNSWWTSLTTDRKLWKEVCQAVDMAVKSKDRVHAAEEALDELQAEWEQWKQRYVEKVKVARPWVSQQWMVGEWLLELAREALVKLTPAQDGTFNLACSTSALPREKDVLCFWLEKEPKTTRQPARHVKIGVLFVITKKTGDVIQETGATGTLLLELVNDGQGDLDGLDELAGDPTLPLYCKCWHKLTCNALLCSPVEP